MALRTVYDAMGDEELRAAVIAREPAAWPAFMAKYERLIGSCVRKVLTRCGAAYSEEDFEDILSQVALLLVKDDYKKLRVFDPARGSKLSTWVGLIATNAAYDHLRRRSPTQGTTATSLDDEATLREPVSENERPDEAAERRDQSAMLRRAFAELSPGDRLFVEYYFQDELDPEDIARLLGISLNTVYSRKNKVRAKLVAILADEIAEAREG